MTRLQSDLTSEYASEEDKIKAMVTQSTQDYDSVNYVKHRGMNGPLPAGYTCYRCGQGGHYIKHCPTNSTKVITDAGRCVVMMTITQLTLTYCNKHTLFVWCRLQNDIKRSTGIPRSFMVSASADTKGALLTANGEYAVPIIDAYVWTDEHHKKRLTNCHLDSSSSEAYKHTKKEKPPGAPSVGPDVAEQAIRIAQEYQCPMCRELLTDAVLTPCCGTAYCDECKRVTQLCHFLSAMIA